MTEGILIALVSTMGLIMSGVLAELVRGRRSLAVVAASVATPAGDNSIAEQVSSIGADVRAVRETVGEHGIKLAVLETRLGDHISSHRAA